MHIYPDDIKNGSIWHADHPWCFRLIAQWIEGDQWMLLSEPEKASHGGSCMIALANASGDTIMGKIALSERLEKMRCTEEKDVETGIVKIIGTQIVGGHPKSLFV